MKLEIARARRKCKDCGDFIEKGEVAGVSRAENPYGTREVSYCKVCTTKGLHVRKKHIEEMLEQIKEM